MEKKNNIIIGYEGNKSIQGTCPNCGGGNVEYTQFNVAKCVDCKYNTNTANTITSKTAYSVTISGVMKRMAPYVMTNEWLSIIDVYCANKKVIDKIIDITGVEDGRGLKTFTFLEYGVLYNIEKKYLVDPARIDILLAKHYSDYNTLQAKRCIVLVELDTHEDGKENHVMENNMLCRYVHNINVKYEKYKFMKFDKIKKEIG